MPPHCSPACCLNASGERLCPSVKTVSGRSCWTLKPTAVCPREVSRRTPSGWPAGGSARRGTGEVNPGVVWPTTKFSAATPLRDLSFLSAPGFESFPHQEEGHAEGCYRVRPPPPKRGVQRAPMCTAMPPTFPPKSSTSPVCTPARTSRPRASLHRVWWSRVVPHTNRVPVPRHRVAAG